MGRYKCRSPRSFNTDPSKRAQHRPKQAGPSKRAKEIIFSRKAKKIYHPSLRFNDSIVSQSPYQKHLGIFLDSQFIFEEHLKVNINLNKTIGLLRKLQNILP